MNNTQLDPGLSAMLAGTNLSIDPGALLPQQQPPFFDADAASSRTTSSSSVPHLPTPDTEHDDDDGDDDDDFEELYQDTRPQKPNTRSKAKMPATRSKTNTTSTTTTTTATSSVKSKRGSAAATGAGAADKRRKRNLERNRAAASKCRQRKKQWQDGLERRKMELESRYKALHSESKELMDEVAQLKNFVMAHAACNDANIDDWIRSEADSFVRRMSSSAQMHQQAPPAAAAAAESMPQMQSPVRGGALAATPPMNGMSPEEVYGTYEGSVNSPATAALNDMFAPPGSKAPFDAVAAADLQPSTVDAPDQAANNIFNQDLLMVSSMQA